MSHIACKGKIAIVLEELGFSTKRIKEILKLLDKKYKEITEQEAESYYVKSNY